MRTSRRAIVAFVLGAAALAAPALAFDGAPVNPKDATIPVVTTLPGTAAAVRGKVAPATAPQETSLSALQYAAEGGHPIAQWKLGRMYANGDGVAQDDLRAFEYFSRIANAHAEDSPSAPQAQIVANAFVALGRYYLAGIPNSKVKADRERARDSAGADETWIKENYNRAFAKASDDDRAMCLQMLEQWVQGRRE